MKTRVLFLAAALAVSAVQTQAQTTVEDTDGNGAYSMDEMMAAYPDLSESDFAEIDSDESGDISAEELTAATEGGLLSN